MEIAHPMGNAIQMPRVPRLDAKSFASPTRRTRSINVVSIKRFISPEPRKTPSATSFAATIR